MKTETDKLEAVADKAKKRRQWRVWSQTRKAGACCETCADQVTDGGISVHETGRVVIASPEPLCASSVQIKFGSVELTRDVDYFVGRSEVVILRPPKFGDHNAIDIYHEYDSASSPNRVVSSTVIVHVRDSAKVHGMIRFGYFHPDPAKQNVESKPKLVPEPSTPKDIIPPNQVAPKQSNSAGPPGSPSFDNIRGMEAIYDADTIATDRLATINGSAFPMFEASEIRALSPDQESTTTPVSPSGDTDTQSFSDVIQPAAEASKTTLCANTRACLERLLYEFVTGKLDHADALTVESRREAFMSALVVDRATSVPESAFALIREAIAIAKTHKRYCGDDKCDNGDRNENEFVGAFADVRDMFRNHDAEDTLTQKDMVDLFYDVADALATVSQLSLEEFDCEFGAESQFGMIDDQLQRFQIDQSVHSPGNNS